jgi:hypothetical protein
LLVVLAQQMAAAEVRWSNRARKRGRGALRWNRPLGLQRKMLINDAAGHTVSTVSFAAALPADPAPSDDEPSIAALIQRGSNFTRNWRWSG